MNMKTLIVYATKYGFTGDCVEKLKVKLDGDNTAVNVLTGTVPELSGYDNIIIGGSVYMGQINKKLKEFINQNLDTLLQKRVALFVCCGLPDNLEATLKNAFPEELQKKAVAVECFGGVLDTGKMKMADKMITTMIKKAVANEGKPEPAPLPENIDKLAKAVNGK
jgi:menaquinone-dependent protoporphyrinogen oxidase